MVLSRPPSTAIRLLTGHGRFFDVLYGAPIACVRGYLHEVLNMPKPEYRVRYSAIGLREIGVLLARLGVRHRFNVDGGLVVEDPVRLNRVVADGLDDDGAEEGGVSGVDTIAEVRRTAYGKPYVYGFDVPNVMTFNAC